MEWMQWLALGIFVAAIVAVISNVIDSTLAALLGVAVMIWLGVMSDEDAFGYVDWNVMAILVSIWLIAGYFGRTGVPSWLSLQALRLSGRLDLVSGRYSQNFDVLRDLFVRPRVVETEDLQFRNDGNSVDLESEMAMMARNTQRYVALSNIQSRNMRSLRNVLQNGQ